MFSRYQFAVVLLAAFGSVALGSSTRALSPIPDAIRSFLPSNSMSSIWDARLMGAGDRREELSSKYNFEFKAVGYFTPSTKATPGGKFVANRKTDVQANGFVVGSSNLVLTNAHLFVDKGKWGRWALNDGKSFGKLSFVIPECERAYAIDSVTVQTFDTQAHNGRDIALVKLKEPVCPSVSPLALRAPSIRLQKNLGTGDATMAVIAMTDRLNNVDVVPTRTGTNCSATLFRFSSGAEVFDHSCDTLDGASGSPTVVSLPSGIFAFGIHRGHLEGDTNNMGIAFNEDLLSWIANAAKTGTISDYKKYPE